VCVRGVCVCVVCVWVCVWVCVGCGVCGGGGGGGGGECEDARAQYFLPTNPSWVSSFSFSRNRDLGVEGWRKINYPKETVGRLWT